MGIPRANCSSSIPNWVIRSAERELELPKRNQLVHRPHATRKLREAFRVAIKPKYSRVPDISYAEMRLQCYLHACRFFLLAARSIRSHLWIDMSHRCCTRSHGQTGRNFSRHAIDALLRGEGRCGLRGVKYLHEFWLRDNTPPIAARAYARRDYSYFFRRMASA